MASDALPLFDCVLAEADHLEEALALEITSKLCTVVRARDTYRLLLPEHVLMLGDAVLLAEDGAKGKEGASSTVDRMAAGAFVPPEFEDITRLVNGQLTALESDAAHVWALGMALYTLLAGYSPFRSTTDACPFFAEFRKSHRLAFPEHVSTPVIETILSMTSIDPAQRVTLDAVAVELIGRQRALSTADSALTQQPGASTQRYSAAGSARNVTSKLAAMAIRPLSRSGLSSSRGSSSSSSFTKGTGGGSFTKALTGSFSKKSSSVPPARASVLATAAAQVEVHAAGTSGDSRSSQMPAELPAFFPVLAPGRPPSKKSSKESSFKEPAKEASPDSSDGSSCMSSPEATPGPKSRSPTGVGTVAAVAAAACPSSPRLFGPHRTPPQPVGALMMPHPNSPHVSVGNMDRFTRPQRPMAVIYSPISQLPRKVSPAAKMPGQQQPGFAIGMMPPQAAMPSAKRGCVRVRRLGWDIAHDKATVLHHLSEALGTLHIAYDEIKQEGASFLGGVLTQAAHVEESMGDGSMRATITLMTNPPPQSTIRMDVSRHSGDTFQFHAFYRSLRELLRPVLSDADNMASAAGPPQQPQPPDGGFAGVPGFTMGDRAGSQPQQARSPRSSSISAMAGFGALGAWTSRAVPRASSSATGATRGSNLDDQLAQLPDVS